MKNFTFYSPTKVNFGKNAELTAADEIKKFGGSRVMIVFGGGSVVKSGLLNKIQQLLEKEGLPYTVLGGVQPNPRLSLVRVGVEQAVQFGVDFILAIGGGSVIDTAKAIAIGGANPQTDIWSFWTGEAVVDKGIPIGSILTIPAAGSETSESAVITNDESRIKRGLNTACNRPRFAIMNPELTFTLPKYQITCGIVDIMMHTLDRYFTLVEENELTDEIAESLLRVVIKNGETAIKNSDNYQAMSELMWCGSISHNGITGLGRAGDFVPHQLGHELSAKFDVAHGASLSTIWGSWAKYCYSERPDRFSHFAQKVWGIKGNSVEENACAGIEKTNTYFKSIDAPTCFSQLGIGIQNDETLQELAERSVFYGKRTLGQFKILNQKDAYEIYKLSNH